MKEFSFLFFLRSNYSVAVRLDNFFFFLEIQISEPNLFSGILSFYIIQDCVILKLTLRNTHQHLKRMFSSLAAN